MGQLREADLRPGDVVLSTGSDWESWLIRVLDAGHYSHVGLFDGERVVMPGVNGIERRPLYASDVFRFHHSGVPLGDGELDPQVLLDHARTYLQTPNRYGYTSLYLAGLLLIMRRLAHPAWRRVPVEVFGGLLLARIRESMDRHLPTGVVALTCSELVTRIFCDARKATGQAWDILVDLEGRHEWPAWPPTSGRFEWLMQATEDTLTQVDPRLPEAVSRARFAAVSASRMPVVAGGHMAPACFVSPGDLEHSPSFVRVGRIEVDRNSGQVRSPPSDGAPSSAPAPSRPPERP